ncbi:Coenzyme F420-reducing hydrogenase, beta subunit [Mariniphaga anaerophila]|uniref:Coenzyme F420-reducing hydrogenase, beta subunit n=1 Tax=Mariniphaga anaerophila TaxID=1484053 RepID=A0A1M5BRR6_9BACT|nr:Coenzyme F420 hydrogenase/dehydrogenase, beta subunit C-terminal domain [Mariniphaga anaerophila]SHF45051.1 Coenzyme F420-reducing hydrogenase, beta subunit [Mariniphaga anaerophila]
MANIPKVVEKVVNHEMCTGCGLCVFECPSKAIEMSWNESGFLVPKVVGECDDNGRCLTVCPFNPVPEEGVKTEDELAEKFLAEDIHHHAKVGKYKGIYAGYANEYRLSSSSGGLATYVCSELLEQGYVDHILSVKESQSEGRYYEYAVSSSKKEIAASSKTRYYPVTLGTIFSELDKLEGKVAIVGVACFVKAIRLSQYKNPVLKEKIPFLIGIICGGLKSRFYTEYLAQKAGASHGFQQPQYRIKNVETSAGDYSFGCDDVKTHAHKTIRMKTVGDMWGTGLFKSNACDFCDDVTCELADISLGDAWIKPYHLDGKGTNLVITRSHFADGLMVQGIQQGKLSLENLNIESLLLSQKGSFNHRHTGLSFRMRSAQKNGVMVAPKRFDQEKVSFDFKIVQKLRMNTRKKSLVLWEKYSNASIFDEKMSFPLKKLKLATAFYHYKKAALNKLKLNRPQ